MIDKYNFYRKVFKKLDPQIDKQLDIFISSDTFNTEFVKDNEIVTLLNSNSKDISSNGVKIVGSDNYYEQNGTLDKKILDALRFLNRAGGVYPDVFKYEQELKDFVNSLNIESISALERYYFLREARYDFDPDLHTPDESNPLRALLKKVTVQTGLNFHNDKLMYVNDYFFEKYANLYPDFISTYMQAVEGLGHHSISAKCNDCFLFGDHWYSNKIIDVPTLIIEIISMQQYLHPSFSINPGDIVLDCGACYGETAIWFNSFLTTGKVYAFEAFGENYEILKKVIDANSCADSVIPILKGVGDKSTRLNLKNAHVANTTGKSFVQSESGEIESISIDSFVDQYNLKKIDIIKMDIEGMEKEAIAGARHSIQKYHPTLLLSAYHKPNDFFYIPEQVKDICEDYNFYFDHKTLRPYELMCYAVHKNKDRII